MANCGTITVEPAFDPSLVTASCDVGTTNASVGDPVTITATVTNQNDAVGSYTLTIEVGSAITETLSGTVGANNTTTESVVVELAQPNDYPVTVGIEASQV
jgi:hypothetical protein